MSVDLSIDLHRTLAASTARLLQAGARSIGALGLGSAALAAAALLMARTSSAATGAALLVLALLPLERLLAFRLMFDAGLFTDLSRQSGPPQAAMGALDQALHALRLRAPAGTARPLADRVNGARRLLAWHLGCVLLQAGATVLLLLSRGPA